MAKRRNVIPVNSYHQMRPLTVLLIGDDGHGKTALINSIDRLLIPPVENAGPPGNPLEGRIPLNDTTRTLEFGWSGREYELISPGSQQDCVEALISENR